MTEEKFDKNIFWEKEHIQRIDNNDVVSKNDEKFIYETLKPEIDLEKLLLTDGNVIYGLNWGKIRRGHPEGKVVLHVKEIFENIDKLFKEDLETRKKLRIIAILHDTFKYRVDQDKPKVDNNHHAVIAKNYFIYFCNVFSYHVDNEVHQILKIIQHHDDVYNIWRAANRKNDFAEAERRVEKLIEKLLINDSLELFCKFYFVDNLAGSKTKLDLYWFFHYLLNNSNIKINESLTKFLQDSFK